MVISVSGTARAGDALSWANTMKGETLRSVVILGHAYADSIILELIKKHLLPAPTRDDRLLHPSGPLGASSARLLLAQRLALIETDAFHALDRLRDLRNRCAHAHPPATFADADVAGKARAFIARMQLHEDYDYLPLEDAVRRGVVSLLSWLEMHASFVIPTKREWVGLGFTTIREPGRTGSSAPPARK